MLIKTLWFRLFRSEKTYHQVFPLALQMTKQKQMGHRLVFSYHTHRWKAIYSPSVFTFPGSFLSCPQITALHNEDKHISPADLSHWSLCHKNQQWCMKYMWLCFPRVPVTGVSAHGKSRIVSTEKVTGTWKAWAVLNILGRFLRQLLPDVYGNFNNYFAVLILVTH